MYLLKMNLKNCKHLVQVFLSFKGFSAGKRTTPTIADNSFSPSIKWYKNSNFGLIFKGSCLKQQTQVLLLQIQYIFLFFMN